MREDDRNKQNMQRKNTGNVSFGQKLMVKSQLSKVGIAVSRFNADITEKMLAGAQKELVSSGVKKENIEVVRVPGSFELPLACQRMAKSEKFDGLIALGCVIKGETDHYYHVAGEASRGIMEVMLTYDIPIGFGVITVNTLEQAEDRAGKHNKGTEAARAALEMLAIF